MGLKNVNRNSGFISLDNICYFPMTAPDGETVYDPHKPTFCAELPISGSEFMNAGMLDIRANVSLAIDSESDMTDELTVQYEGKVYAIYRRYLMGNGLTQLYLSEKAGVS